jgi:arrestin-related trafficking adapter 1
MDHLKRHTLTGRHHSDKKSPKIDPKRPAKMDMEVESPPLVFYNQPQSSTGALLSGQLKVQVTDPTVTFEKFEMRLLATVTTKKPVSHNCPDCTTQTTEIYKWEFLKVPTPLNHGDHSFPFSYLLPGHLPATTHGSLASLDYHLAAVATSSTGENITYQRSINIKRAVMPGNDKHSIRVFPPTDLTAHVTLPPVIHPIGDFGMEMRLSGLNTKTKDALTRWRLRKLNWRIEENQKFVSPACPKHAQKVGGEGKGILHDEMRVIAHEEVKSEWKTDFEEGNADIEFKAAVNTALKPLCDVESPNGLSITHNLVIEIVVAEEWAPLKKPNQATPTGAARVLRMQFNIVLTERSGLGISWDEEQPPMYEDVPASPPTYTQMEDFNIEELDNEVDRLHL